jgi:hypothetical protein
MRGDSAPISRVNTVDFEAFVALESHSRGQGFESLSLLDLALFHNYKSLLPSLIIASAFVPFT